jgi:hypothetical protein
MGAHQVAGWGWVAGGIALSVGLCQRRGSGLLRLALSHRAAIQPA